MAKPAIKFPEAYHLLYIFFGCYIYYYFVSPPVFIDPDLPWIISTGALIRENGSLPLYDSFSFTAQDAGYRWYNVSWLWCIIISLLHDSFGLSGLYYAGAILQCSCLTMLAYTLLKRKISPHIVYAITFINILVFAHISPLRPNTATLILAILFLYFLEKSRSGKRHLYILPPLMALWCNLHWGFMVGFALIFTSIVEAYAEKKLKRLDNLIKITLFCLLATLVNPYGYGIINAFTSHFLKVSSSIIGEWQPMQFGQLAGLDFLIFTLLVASNYRSKRIPLADKLNSFIWLVATIYSMRNAILLGAISAFFMAKTLQNFVSKETLHKYDNKTLKKWDVALVVIVISLSLIYPANLIVKNLAGKKENIMEINKEKLAFTGNNPRKAIEFIEKNYPKKKFMNHFDYGSYITYFTGGKVKNFIDGRFITAYPPELVDSFTRIYDFSTPVSELDFKLMVKKYGVEGLFFPNHYIKLIPGLEKNWKLVYKDQTSSVYLKK